MINTLIDDMSEFLCKRRGSMKIISPLAVYLPRKTMKDKKLTLNLNYFIHWHRAVKGQSKEAYYKAIEPQLKGLKFDKVSLVFKYYKKTKASCDRANIYSVHEKYFCDSLVKHGVIKDDKDSVIIESKYLSVELDRENPRVEIDINEA